ncbi:MAG: hypothetical protein ACREXP_00200 [Steroidobacteraceae bacterium]
MAKQTEAAETTKPDPASGDPSPLDRPVTLGRIVHVTDYESGKVHPAIVTHVTEEDQSIVATVFVPFETQAGKGFKRSEIGLATRGCWHWPT